MAWFFSPPSSRQHSPTSHILHPGIPEQPLALATPLTPFVLSVTLSLFDFAADAATLRANGFFLSCLFTPVRPERNEVKSKGAPLSPTSHIPPSGLPE